MHRSSGHPISIAHLKRIKSALLSQLLCKDLSTTENVFSEDSMQLSGEYEKNASKLIELSSKNPHPLNTTQIVYHFLCSLLELDGRCMESVLTGRKRLQALLDLEFPKIGSLYPRYLDQPARLCVRSSFLCLFIITQMQKRFQNALAMEIQGLSLSAPVAEKLTDLKKALEKWVDAQIRGSEENRKNSFMIASVLLALEQDDLEMIQSIPALLKEGKIDSFSEAEGASHEQMTLSLIDYELLFLFLYGCSNSSDQKVQEAVATSIRCLHKHFSSYQFRGLFSFFLDENLPRRVIYPSSFAESSSMKKSLAFRISGKGSALRFPGFCEMVLFDQDQGFDQEQESFWSAFCSIMEEEKSWSIPSRLYSLGVLSCAFLDPRLSERAFAKIETEPRDSGFYLERKKRTTDQQGSWRSGKLDHLLVSHLFSLGTCSLESEFSIQKKEVSSIFSLDASGKKERWPSGKKLSFSLCFPLKPLQEMLFPTTRSGKGQYYSVSDAALVELVFPINTLKGFLKSFQPQVGSPVLGGNVFECDGLFQLAAKAEGGQKTLMDLQVKSQSLCKRALSLAWYLQPCSLQGSSFCRETTRDSEQLHCHEKGISLVLCAHPRLDRGPFQEMIQKELDGPLQIDLHISYQLQESS